MIKIIFVSEEDTLLGPLAEHIMKATLPLQNDYEVLSRGRVVLFPEPYNLQVQKILIRHGMKMDEEENEAVSVPFSIDEVNENTIILTMSMQQKINLLEDYGNLWQIYSLAEFAGESEDVPDPYGGTEEDYEKCFLELERLIKLIIQKLSTAQSYTE